MMNNLTPKSRKTFPLEMDESLHKALKIKAIEANKTLHAYIIETLEGSVQEEKGPYLTQQPKTSEPA